MRTSWWKTAFGPGREPSTDQQEAITAPHTGRRSVNAGAGTGKTSTLALRALYLIESGHVRADQIVVVTFTKKAAGEIGARIADTIDRAIAAGASFPGHGRGVRCTTIHALAADLLREFALDFGFVTEPRAIGDGEARAAFHDAFAALLSGALAVDTSAFPIAEVNLDALERDLGKLALRLKNHGIAPSTFEANGLRESERFGAQTWGQLWTEGASPGRRITLAPKPPISAAEIALEASREAANVRVVAALFAEFDRITHARGLATYGDLIGLTTRHLGEHPAIVARLRERFRYCLLDESQDTSALQWRFLETLFGRQGEADAAGMMPVGDARQAIYGFNGADEGVMARIAASADSTHPLTINRRSPQEIVDAAHHVLAGAGAIDPAIPMLTSAAGSGTMACIRVQNFGVDGGSIKEHVQAEAEAIAREIERLLTDAASVKPSDVAILVRRRTHAATYVRELNLRGIAGALDRRSGLFAADEVRDAIAWMSLLSDLSDRQAAVRIMQSPLGGMNDAAMIDFAASSDWLERFLRDELASGIDAETRERLVRLRAWLVVLLPAVALPLALATERLLDAVPIVASYARIGETVGAQAIVNLRSFRTLAEEFAHEHPGARLAEFVRDVKQRILYDDEPEEAELDLDGVRVMTIHQAKGLEWPYVFVACSTKNQYGTSGPSDALVTYDLASGAFALKNDVDGRETFRWECLRTEHDAATGQRVEDRKKALARREQARVFYVAVTRARLRAYVTAPAPDGKTSHAPYLDSIRAWACGVEPGIDLHFHTVADAGAEERPHARPIAPAIAGVDRVAPPAQLSLFRPRVSFTAISAYETCPRMARLRYRLRLPGLRDASPRYAGFAGGDGPAIDAKRLGSLTHRTLELWGAARLRGANGDLDAALDAAALEFADATAVEIDDARRRAAHAVAALAEFTIVAVEQPFEIAIGTTVLEGSIDLVARAPDGKLWVIDYKTGRTGDDHYELQLALYRHAAMRRYAEANAAGAILRLTPTAATLSTVPEMPFDDLTATVTDAGTFENDTPKPGVWCAGCAYNGAPCLAPSSSLACRPESSQ